MDQITSPHDKFFKEVFTRRGTAEEFLQHYLPDEVAWFGQEVMGYRQEPI